MAGAVGSQATRPEKAWPLILAALVVADVTATFENQMILAALKSLYLELRDPVGVGWIVSAYLVVAAAAAAICARMGDLYGHRRIIVITLAVAAAGSIISANSSSLAGVIAGRALQGLTGGIFPLCYGILRDSIPERYRSLSSGVLLTATALGALAGLVIGGWIVDNYHWRILFWLSAILAAASALMVQILVPPGQPHPHSRDLDIVGGILFVPGVVALLIAISKLKDWGFGDYRFIGLTLGSLAIIAVWIRYEYRHSNPLLDVKMLAQRELALANLSIFMVGLAPFQLTLVMMMLLQQSPATGIGLGLTAAAAGALKIPGNIASTITTPLSGHLCESLGERFIALTGFGLNMASWALLLAGFHSFWAIFAAIVACTIGGSMCLVGVNNNVMRISPQARVSEAIGMVTLVRSISVTLGAQILTIILGAAVLGTSGSAVSVYSTAFAFLLVFSTAGFLITCGFRRNEGAD